MRSKLLRLILCACLLASLALSYPLWLSSRTFPFAPLFNIRPLPRPFDLAVFAAMLVLLLAIPFMQRPRLWIAAFLALALIAAIQDQTRWQPWFYQCSAMLAVIAIAGDEDSPFARNTCRLILASIYLWSGASKLNPNFASQMVPFLLEPFFKFDPGRLSYLAAILESSVGVALLFPRSRRIAVVAGASMHAFLLLALGPLGRNYNSVVWPWNAMMMALLFLLYWNSAAHPRGVLFNPGFATHKAVFALFAIAPAFSFIGLGDSYPSFSLYNRNTDVGSIYLTDAAYERLPFDPADYTDVEAPGFDAGKPNRLSISDWATAELNVFPYPEPRVYRAIARRVCGEIGNRGLTLVIAHKRLPWGKPPDSIYSCPDL